MLMSFIAKNIFCLAWHTCSTRWTLKYHSYQQSITPWVNYKNIKIKTLKNNTCMSKGALNRGKYIPSNLLKSTGIM